MKNISKLLLLSTTLSCLAVETNASEAIVIKPTSKAALLDGHCGNDEWDAATKIDLPAEVSIYVMHYEESFYICAKAKPDDYTVIDLHIEHPETGHHHHFHLSAQMGERVRTDEGWGESRTWDLKDYAGFWVPYFGLEDPENRKNPKFARGTHRQVQILRSKFPGDTWKMMVGISGVRHEGNRAEYFYPKKAVDTDMSTWAKFSFSK